jgi:plastocyanin
MRRKSLAALAILAATALAAAGTAFSGSAKTRTLKGVVGPGFTISLKMGGKKVKSLKAGTYKFVITDRSSIHNYTVEREKGGHIEKHVTSTPFTGSKTAVIQLKPGSWSYYCSVHESQMHGDFKVKK